MCKANHAGRDIVHFENKTHIELNTRHVVAKTGGFRLFDVHEEGSGGGPPGPVAQGITGIGIVGEILILMVAFMLVLWVIRKYTECRSKNAAYRGFYRAQVASSGMALPPPATTRDYGPNNRATSELLMEVRAARQELRAAKRSADVSSTVTTATVHNKGPAKARHVYDDSDEEKC